MDNLLLCSRTLYDKDILDKSREIEELRKENKELKKDNKMKAYAYECMKSLVKYNICIKCDFRYERCQCCLETDYVDHENDCWCFRCVYQKRCTVCKKSSFYCECKIKNWERQDWTYRSCYNSRGEDRVVKMLG